MSLWIAISSMQEEAASLLLDASSVVRDDSLSSYLWVLGSSIGLVRTFVVGSGRSLEGIKGACVVLFLYCAKRYSLVSENCSIWIMGLVARFSFECLFIFICLSIPREIIGSRSSRHGSITLFHELRAWSIDLTLHLRICLLQNNQFMCMVLWRSAWMDRSSETHYLSKCVCCCGGGLDHGTLYSTSAGASS
jgi:hypothetical protein